MRGPKPPPIELTCRQRLVLERLVRQATCAQRTVTRAQIILLSPVFLKRRDHVPI